MSKNIWEDFDKNVDLEGLQKDLDEFEKKVVNKLLKKFHMVTMKLQLKNLK